MIKGVAKLKVFVAYAVLLVIWGSLVWYGDPWIAGAYLVVSTIVYVAFISWSLLAQERDDWYTDRWGVEAGFQKFRTLTSIIMNNFGTSIVVFVLTTTWQFPVDLPLWLHLGVGAVLSAIGLGVKGWANKTIGDRGYYWYDYFAPPEEVEHADVGPYKWFSNPMYTVGYLHAYGLSIGLGSLPGIFAAIFMQSCVLGFWWFVERPHYQRLYGEGGERASSGGDVESDERAAA